MKSGKGPCLNALVCAECAKMKQLISDMASAFLNQHDTGEYFSSVKHAYITERVNEILNLGLEIKEGDI